jgi:hypothetical protein
MGREPEYAGPAWFAPPPAEPEPEAETEPDVEPVWEPQPAREPEAEAEAEPDLEPLPEPEREPAWLEQPEPEPEVEPAYVAPAPTDRTYDEPREPEVEAREAATAFVPEAAQEAGAIGGEESGWNPKVHGERRRPTTAEQAVPWLIGVILALAGIVIVLLALIFTAPDGMLGLTASPSPSPSGTLGGLLPTGSAAATRTPNASPRSASPTAEPTPAATATPLPEYGPLEMVYLGRPSALEPIYLFRRDFSEREDPNVVAQADIGVSAYTWAPDGRVGAAIIGERLVALRPGRSARRLFDGASAAAFGLDSQTIYALRIVQRGGDDIARVLEIDYRSGDSRVVGSVRYPRPAIAAEPALREAQFIDDGGIFRLYPLSDGSLVIWILGAPETYRMDTEDGSVEEVRRQPLLWSPDGSQRVVVRERANGTSDLHLRDSGGETTASVNVPGLVSHVRWVRSSNEIVFTLGRLGTSGGVRQDLYVWDLVDGNDPLPLTSNGVSFGAEWLGSAPNWRD